MGIGFRPIRGNWRTVPMTTASAATFQQWAPVDWDGHRDLIEATSASTTILGVALSNSTASFTIPITGGNVSNGILVAIPMDQSAVAEATVPTNAARSALSFGQVYNIIKNANNMQVDTASQASYRVQIVSNGLVDSTRSTVEVIFLTNFRAYGSASSVSIY